MCRRQLQLLPGVPAARPDLQPPRRSHYHDAVDPPQVTASPATPPTATAHPRPQSPSPHPFQSPVVAVTRLLPRSGRHPSTHLFLLSSPVRRPPSPPDPVQHPHGGEDRDDQPHRAENVGVGDQKPQRPQPDEFNCPLDFRPSDLLDERQQQHHLDEQPGDVLLCRGADGSGGTPHVASHDGVRIKLTTAPVVLDRAGRVDDNGQGRHGRHGWASVVETTRHDVVNRHAGRGGEQVED